MSLSYFCIHLNGFKYSNITVTINGLMSYPEHLLEEVGVLTAEMQSVYFTGPGDRGDKMTVKKGVREKAKQWQRGTTRDNGRKDNWRCPWCNGYHRRKWTRRHEFKSWTRLIAFHIALIPSGKI